MINSYKIVGWDVDTQNDFMQAGVYNNRGYDGKLAIADAMTIAPNLNRLTQYLRNSNIPILGSVDDHLEDSKEFPLVGEEPDYINTFNEHCLRGSYGAMKIDATRPLNPLYVNWDQDYDDLDLFESVANHQGEVFFRKNHFDVFNVEGNPYSKDIVKDLGIKKAIVYGVALEVCNDFAIKGLRDLGVEVYAVQDAMKAIDETKRDLVLSSWNDIGVNIVNLEDILNGGYLKN